MWFLSTNVLSPWSLKTCSLNVPFYLPSQDSHGTAPARVLVSEPSVYGVLGTTFLFLSEIRFLYVALSVTELAL